MDNLTLVVRRSAAQHSTARIHLELLTDNLTLVVRRAASQHSTDTPGAADGQFNTGCKACSITAQHGTPGAADGQFNTGCKACSITAQHGYTWSS